MRLVFWALRGHAAGVTGPSEGGSKKDERERKFGKRSVIDILIPLLGSVQIGREVWII